MSQKQPDSPPVNMSHSTSRREVFGWAMFDVANSAYTTIIITVAFNSIFAELITGPDTPGGSTFTRGNWLWAVVVSSAAFLAAILSPLFGAMSDVSQSRKKFLGFSVALCAGATAGLYFVEPGQVAFAASLIILSNLGFALSENFISSFLPHISNESNIGKISGLAWGLGYFGGLLSIVIVQAATGLNYRPENFELLRLVGPLTALFFVVASIPTFIFVREPKVALANTHTFKDTVIKAYRELGATLRHLADFQDLARFLVSFFFFQGGLAIVISFAALYGKQVVGIDGKWQTIFFVSLQLTAAAGAFSFGWLQHHIGALKSVNITLGIWITTILMIFYLKEISSWFPTTDTKAIFIVIGNFAGFCLGATQSSARALVGMFSPPDRSGEFYGFWGLAGKLASVTATLTFGALQKFFNLQNAMLMCSLFFVVGLLVNLRVNEKRGILRSRAS